ncbi:hypothetical protein [Polyangium spumosum]|uniref:Lipoprotein n=1 Tax=Polyangium spumosum TaxID=889282 RepID=A0A6N7PZ44_9BACT|nr:hypothetical protein [Polyangium spumosum]MRG95565.1 hypothetical protein [Polyangium spumosum]
MSFRYLLATFALVPVAVVMGCGSGEMMEEVATASTRQALGDPNFEMPQNGLDPDTVLVNLELLAAWKDHPLSSAGFSAMLAQDPSFADRFDTGTSTSAEEIMADIVSCALDSTRVVTASTPSEIHSWRGQFGLCGSTASAGSWWDAPPTKACLELVSGCVLARMNKLGRQVPISIHVPSADDQRLHRVRAQRTRRDRTSIGSFQACPFGVFGPTDTCGWRAEFVGICQRGAQVTLQRNGASQVRVCKGIHGCEKGEQASGYPGFLPHAGFVAQFHGSEPITFTCPTDVGVGPSGRPDHTYFSIMAARVPLSSPLESDPVTGSGSTFTYPAKEREVFTYPEGAFYGDVFSGSKENYGYVCHSELWRSGKAHLADRLCADPDDDDCDALLGHAACLDVCEKGLVSPEEAYAACEGGARDWDGATVFLNDPHDLSSDPAASATQCTPHDECTTGAPLPHGCSPVVKSVCAVDPYCCTTAWDAICVSEAQSVSGKVCD